MSAPAPVQSPTSPTSPRRPKVDAATKAQARALVARVLKDRPDLTTTAITALGRAIAEPAPSRSTASCSAGRCGPWLPILAACPVPLNERLVWHLAGTGTSPTAGAVAQRTGGRSPMPPTPLWPHAARPAPTGASSCGARPARSPPRSARPPSPPPRNTGHRLRPSWPGWSAAQAPGRPGRRLRGMCWAWPGHRRIQRSPGSLAMAG